MDAAVLAQIEAEAAANPMGRGAVPLLLSRVLLADGDALAYAAAGNDDTPAGRARHNLIEKVAAARAVSGAGDSKILTTAASSHKGFRFAVARAKAYQGHRKGARRPKNWGALRDALEFGSIPGVELTTVAEADDLFGKWSTLLGPENVVIYTEDKDMRMVPGWHLDWHTHSMHYVAPGTWEATYNDKVFGRKWFWLQMLQGDSADNIPGLPNLYPDNRRSGLVGPATATKILDGIDNEFDAQTAVIKAYSGYYGDRWMPEFLEQGILLWMRNDEFSSPFNVIARGNPLDTEWNHDAVDEMKQRIKESL